MVKFYFFSFKLNKKNRSTITNGEIVFFFKIKGQKMHLTTKKNSLDIVA